jgi:hypothetical protein
MDDTATHHMEAVTNLITWHQQRYRLTEVQAIRAIREALTAISKHGAK